MNVWEEIKQKVNIVEVVSDYLPVKQVGGYHKIVCPFHKDRNPSLILSPDKNIWHCFGCGAGGDVFGFVEQYEGVSRKQALEILAKKVGVDLKIYQKNRQQQSAVEKNLEQHEFFKGFDYLAWASAVYHKIIINLIQDRSNPITGYCLERGLDIEIIKQFQIGYAPKGNFLVKLIEKYNLDKELFLKIGLIKLKDGLLKDKFTDRLIIPIDDRMGRVVGFTARNFPYDTSERPRYLNSDQSIWFNKSEIWYGWFLNQKNIKKEKTAILVEGNMDVIASYKAGLYNVLASQGTSFTEEQLRVLKRITNSIAIAFDNDEAGITSTHKLFLSASKMGFSVDKILFPEKFKDLDEYLKSLHLSSATEIKRIDKVSYENYFFDRNLAKLKSRDTRTQKKAIEDIIEMISVLDDISTEQQLQKLKSITGLSYTALKNELLLKKKGSRSGTVKHIENNYLNQDSTSNGVLVAWQNLLSEYLFRNNFELNLSLSNDFTILQNIFNLLKLLIPQLSAFQEIQTYIDQNADIWKLIHENSNQDFNKSKLIIKKFLASNFETISRNNLDHEAFLKIQTF